MLCQVCNQKEATVHITKIINGVKTEAHLCDDCAKQKQELNSSAQFNFGIPLSFQNILDGFFEFQVSPNQYVNNEVSCPVCHTTFDDFRRTGRFGCSNCYTVFESKTTPIVRRIHGNIEHIGKVPRRTGGVLKVKRDIDKLKEELKIAVANEEYEKAAKLRDKIRDLESNMGDK